MAAKATKTAEQKPAEKKEVTLEQILALILNNQQAQMNVLNAIYTRLVPGKDNDLSKVN